MFRSGFMIIGALFAIFWFSAGVPAKCAEMAMNDVPWQEIGQIARSYVAQESPDDVWPFERASAADLAKSPHKVFAHYFPPYPLSIENKPAEQDYYATQYMKSSGEGNKFAAQGGLLRQRPLPVGPWKSPYWREINAAIDVLRAQLIGLDGFGVDIVDPGKGTSWDQAFRLCAAAAALAPNFYFVPEIDGAILAKASVEEIVELTSRLAACPSLYRLSDKRILFIPFAPQNQGVPFWKDVEDRLHKQGIEIAFVPDLLDLAASAKPFASISAGMTFWGPRDPVTAKSKNTIRTEDTAASLTQFLMRPVAPQDARPKDSIFWEADNTELFRDLWTQAIEGGGNYVHLITWNDYSEATQIEPSSGSQFLFYDLTAFYTQWFKQQKQPRIKKDALFYCHRNQIFAPDHPVQPGEKSFARIGDTPLTNDIEIIALLTADASIEISLGDKIVKQSLPAGLNTFKIPAAAGRPAFRIKRNNQIAVELESAWDISANPDKTTPDYFGGSSTRKPVSLGSR